MRLLPLALLSTTLIAARTEAQQFGLDATAATRHVWRGITRKNGYVAQADGYVTLRYRDLWVTAGAWTNLELERSGSSDLTDRGTGRWGFTELDYWLEASLPWEGIESSLGYTAYTFITPRPSPGRGSASNTRELYGRVGLRWLYLSPRVTAYWDIDRVDGLYLEADVSLPVLANPVGRRFWSLFLGARAGFNVSQGPDPSEPSELAHFAGRGFTHLDLSAAIHLNSPVLPAGTHATLHVQLNRDAATERGGTGPSDRRPRTVWLALTTSLPDLSGGD
jgi:hypothetical protein